MTTPARLPNPVDYRTTLCKNILAELARGRSCTIIGVGSSGKSNVARQLARRDAREFIFGEKQLNMPEAADGMACVLVDFQSYGDDDASGLHSLFIESLLNAAQVADAHPALTTARDELRAVLAEAHAAADNSKRTRFCLSESVRIAFTHGLKQLVFVLDDFDNGLKRAPGAALNGLRALRDNYKGALMYAAVMRREMAFVRPATEEYEDFYELVNKPVFAVGAFEEADAFGMLRSISGGNVRLGLLEQRWLVELSGGHPGLLRKLFFAADQGKIPFNMTSIVDTVCARNDIQVECELIWDSLDADEQSALRIFASGKPTNEAALARLRAKTLLRDDGRGRMDIFSPVFARFVGSDAAQVGSPASPTSATPTRALTTLPSGTRAAATLVFNPTMRSVQIEGRTIALIDDVEYHLLERLYKHRNSAVQSRDLLEIVIKFRQQSVRRFPGSPENKRDRYMDELTRKVNLPDRIYIVRNDDGSYRFQEVL